MQHFDYHIKYHINHNIIISEAPIPYFPIEGINFRGKNNVLFLKNGVRFHPNTKINFWGNESLVYLGDSKKQGNAYYFNLNVFNNSVVYFGGDTYFNPSAEPMHIKISEMTNLLVGKSSLFSTGINIESTDSHLLYENENGELKRTNHSKDVVLENHVWIGRNVSLNKGAIVKSGTVVGNNSVVTKSFTNENAVIVGVPAKQVKDNIFWRGNSTQGYDEALIAKWETYVPSSEERDYAKNFTPYLDMLKNDGPLTEKFANNALILDYLTSNLDVESDKSVHDEFIKLFDFFDGRFQNDTVELVTNSDDNVHELAIVKNDAEMQFAYRNYLANDFVLASHENQTSYFIKRNSYTPAELEDESVDINERLRRYKNILFRFEYLGQRITDADEKKMIVIFSGMPATDDTSNTSLTVRGGYPLFSQIKRSLVKDTFVLRIVDANLGNGSFYLNTANYPNFEDEIQEVIRIFASSYNIPKKNIVMFGVDKGGFASLYHGLIGGYASVNSDPIIDDSIYAKNGRDPHFQEAFRELNMIPKINKLLEDSDTTIKKYLIGNRHVDYTYAQYQHLNMEDTGVILYDTDDNVDAQHHIILRSAIPQILVMINSLLDDNLRL